MKTFLVHLKAGGTPLKYEALNYETIGGKIYFFKDEEKKDRSLFVDESAVSAITEEQTKHSVTADMNLKHPIVISFGAFIILEILGAMFIGLEQLGHLLVIAITAVVYFVFKMPDRFKGLHDSLKNIQNLRSISFREEWGKIGFKHPAVWGLIGFLTFGIGSHFTKSFLVVTGILKVVQLLFVVVAIVILLIRLYKNTERKNTLIGKILLGTGMISLLAIAFVMFQIYSDFLSYSAGMSTIKNLGYWESVLTKTSDGYVAFTPDDYEMRDEYGGDKEPCVYQFRGGTFLTEPAELTASEKLDGYVWKAKGIFKFDAMRKLDLHKRRWLKWHEYIIDGEYAIIGEYFKINVLRDKNDKWMIIYTQELTEMVIDLSKLPSVN